MPERETAKIVAMKQKSEVISCLTAPEGTDQDLQSSILRPRDVWVFAYNRIITNDIAHSIITTLTASIAGAKV